MSVSAGPANSAVPMLRLHQPAPEPAEWAERAVGPVLDLYQRMPAYSPATAGAAKLCGLAMKVLEGAVLDRDWSQAEAALVILTDAHAVAQLESEIAPELATATKLVIAQRYREAIRELYREQHDARRQAYREGVNDGQRAFCEGGERTRPSM